MIQLINRTNSVTIGFTDFPRNSLEFEVNETNETVRIDHTAKEDVVIEHKHYSEFKKSDNTAYTTLSSLLTDLRSFLFSAQA